MAEGHPVVLLLDLRAGLVEVVEVFLGLDQPVLELDFVLLSDEDAAGGEAAMHDVVLVEEGDAFDDGREGADDFFFGEMDKAIASLPIFQLYLEGGFLLEVEESVVVLDGLEEGLVHNVGLMLGLRIGLKILVGFLGGFVQ